MSLAYHAYRSRDGFSERALYVIDPEGKVHWGYISPVGLNPGADGILRALEDMDDRPMNMTQWVAQLVLPVSSERDHILGPPEAPVTLAEYGDYECPHCGRAYPIIEAAHAQMGNELRFAFRHFPVTTVHPHAEPAAEAAEAPVSRGPLADARDVVRDQDGLRARDLHTYAEVLGLDVARFDAELLAGVHTPRVREDFMSGVRSGVNGTPTFFMNELRYDGSWDAPDLLAALSSAADPVAS